MSQKRPIIGLVGGIGAGKSMVAGEFERLGCLVIASDRLNHEVLRSPEVAEQLRDWWGPTVTGPDGQPDHERIAEIVFDDPIQKQRLETLVHPLIARRRVAMIKAVEDTSTLKAIVIDSPLLLESNLDRECTTIVFIEASEPLRLRRLQLRRGWNDEELKRRERWQASLAQKRSRSEFVVTNDGPIEQLRPQVADILEKIVARRS